MLIRDEQRHEQERLDAAQQRLDADRESKPDNAELARLAALDPVSYDRERKEAAKRLGCRIATLDAEVANLRPPDDANSAGRQLPFPEVEPYPEKVIAAEVLDEVLDLITRHVVAEPHTLHAATLWAVMTWFADHATVLPLAVITAPEKGCGKTTLLSVLGQLARRPLLASNISPAALFRCVEAWTPSLLIDEADTFAKDNEELRGIINSGHTRETARVIRAVEISGEFEPCVFSTWGPKALAGIGHLPETIMSRAVVLTLRRALPNERVANLRHADRAPFDAVQQKLARWAEDDGATFATLRPTMPELSNRSADNWEPLFALADLAGEVWPDRARQAARMLTDADHDVPSIGEELLADIQAAFNGSDRISSEVLLERLTADPEARWASWNRGKPMGARQLAGRLDKFKIKPRTIRIGDLTIKGYLRDQFEDAFSRYLSATPPLVSVTPSQRSNGAGSSDFRSVTTTPNVTDAKTPKALQDKACDGVTDRNPLERQEGKKSEGWL